MYELILVGNPNVGKTTLFNTLTKSNERASNWHGVTVAEKSKQYKFEDETYRVVDLPGLYSLGAYSNEEKIARDYLLSHKQSLVINICDANNLERNLKLTYELIALGLNTVLAVNMSNEINVGSKKELAYALGIPVIFIDARKGKSVRELKVLVSDLLREKTQNISKNSEKQIKYDILSKIIKNICQREPYKISDKIDKVVLNKFAFPIIFILSIFLVFYITFGLPGECFSGIINLFFNKIFDVLRKIISCVNISIIVKSFLTDGVINSLSTILSFLPQIMLLMFLINLLEDMGFMSRIAFMLDGFLKKFGLTGKSLFSIMMGYGCTASAAMTTRNLENKKLRLRTALLLPFSTCSAKLPVFLVISSLFFGRYKYLFVLGLYLFSILISLICAIIYKRAISDSEDVFIMEMPKFRLPYLKKIILDSLRVIGEFVIKVGTLILFFSSILWLLQNFSLELDYLQGENFTHSILYFISNKLSVLFNPIGLGNAGIVASLLLGLVAKELVVVGLAMINGTQGAALSLSLISPNSVCYFTPISSIIFLVFILLYSPCISAIGAIKNEFGTKVALYVFVFQFVLSYAVSLLLYGILTLSIAKCAVFLLIALVILTPVMIKLFYKKKSCRGNCNVCRKIYSTKK